MASVNTCNCVTCVPISDRCLCTDPSCYWNHIHPEHYHPPLPLPPMQYFHPYIYPPPPPPSVTYAMVLSQPPNTSSFSESVASPTSPFNSPIVPPVSPTGTTEIATSSYSLLDSSPSTQPVSFTLPPADEEVLDFNMDTTVVESSGTVASSLISPASSSSSSSYDYDDDSVYSSGDESDDFTYTPRDTPVMAPITASSSSFSTSLDLDDVSFDCSVFADFD